MKNDILNYIEYLFSAALKKIKEKVICNLRHRFGGAFCCKYQYANQKA